jgi:hypothetical protein
MDHWAEVTLSMKNLFGLGAGRCLWLAEKPAALEGHRSKHPRYQFRCPGAFRHYTMGSSVWRATGRCMAPPRNLGRIGLADEPVAADFVCTRLMGLNPLRVNYLAQAAEFLGNGTPERIVHLGERLPSIMQSFAVLPEFVHLRL